MYREERPGASRFVATAAVLEVTWTGTHTGPLDGPAGTVAPTGKKQTTRSGWVMEFESGRVKSSRHYFDMLSFLQQLGVPSLYDGRRCPSKSSTGGSAMASP